MGLNVKRKKKRMAKIKSKETNFYIVVVFQSLIIYEFIFYIPHFDILIIGKSNKWRLNSQRVLYTKIKIEKRKRKKEKKGTNIFIVKILIIDETRRLKFIFFTRIKINSYFVILILIETIFIYLVLLRLPHFYSKIFIQKCTNIM